MSFSPGMQRAEVSICDIVVDVEEMRPPVAAAVADHGVSYEHAPQRPGAQVTQPSRHEAQDHGICGR